MPPTARVLTPPVLFWLQLVRVGIVKVYVPLPMALFRYPAAAAMHWMVVVDVTVNAPM